jgi:hypothetical protein
MAGTKSLEQQTRAQVQPKDGFAKIAPVIFPPVAGGLLLQASPLQPNKQKK